MVRLFCVFEVVWLWRVALVLEVIVVIVVLVLVVVMIEEHFSRFLPPLPSMI